MTCNLIIIAASLSLFIAICIYCNKRWDRFNIIDLYLAFVGLHFGVSPSIKALLQDYSQAYPLAIILTFSQVYVIVGIIAIVSAYLPENLKKELEIRYLFQKWAGVSTVALWALLGIIFFIQALGYWKYNIISHVDQGGLARIGKKLPYWFSSELFLLNDFIFCAFIGLAVKIIEVKGLGRKFLVMPLMLLLAVAAIYGRRLVINLAVVGIILWFIRKERNICQFKYLKIFFILAAALFIFSNIFQAYRGVLQFPPYVKFDELKNPLAAALDGHATLKDIKERPAPWEFNYDIFFGQLSGLGGEVPYGTLLWQGIKNSIPGIFWKNKTVRNLNNLTASRYGMPVEDYAKNNFGFAQADFGYFSLMAMPIMMITIFIIMALIIKLTTRQPLLLWLLSGIILNYLVNIEQNEADVIILFRNIMLFSMFYAVGYFLLKIFDDLQRNLRLRTAASPVVEPNWHNDKQ